MAAHVILKVKPDDIEGCCAAMVDDVVRVFVYFV